MIDTNSGTATPLPEGLVARAARALGYVVTGNAGGWFGPLAPMPPQAPADVAGRAFDFPSGYNLVQRPRAYEGTGFAELRALADSYDLVRLIVETRKDQIERLSWSVRARERATSAKDDPRIDAISALLACPDGVHPWTTWLRMVLEDLLVIDAPALYLRRTRDGRLCTLEPLDGATIKRVIDDWGRTPAPPAPAYQQVLKGLPAVDYTTDELLYLPRNPRVHRVYGFSPVEQVQMTVNIALRRQVWQLQYYTEGNIPEALIGVPDTWTPDQIRQFQGYWDSLHEGNTAQRRHAKFVPGGVAKTFIPTREPALKDPFDEWLARVVCYAFSVSPQPFVPQLNRATAETAQDAALAEGLLPLKTWVKQLCDRVIAREFAAPDLEFAWSDDQPSDPEKVAAVAVDYVKAGIKSVNEVRAELGLDPVPGGDHPAIGVAPAVRSQGKEPHAPPVHEKAALLRFDPSEARDWHGRWTADDGGGGPVRPVSARSASGRKAWLGRSHAAFRQKIAEAEQSANRKDNGNGAINHHSGALGRYQLTRGTLENAGWTDRNGNWIAAKGITSTQQFLRDPDAQERAIGDVMRHYESELETNGSYQYIGRTYRGVEGPITITQAGLVAAAHRQGAGAVATYLRALEANGWKSGPRVFGALPGEKNENVGPSIEHRMRVFQNVPY
ncbi:MAG: phage portal protein [Alphaproteobacteria bacterium]|nr:phage portal protein [Alphaproteobacteria bacterium]